MIPQTQTDTSRDNGNCWKTAIACVIDRDAEEVPHFLDIHATHGLDWWKYTYEWLWHHGYQLVDIHRHLFNGEYYLVLGYTERKTFHVCVYHNGKMVHDPHPSGAGLLDEYNHLAIRKL